MKYKIAYTIPPSAKIHHRYYTALTQETAEHMFQETVQSGGLIGRTPEIVGVYKLIPMRWKKIN